jgi:hypothetical protein
MRSFTTLKVTTTGVVMLILTTPWARVVVPSGV